MCNVLCTIIIINIIMIADDVVVILAIADVFVQTVQ